MELKMTDQELKKKIGQLFIAGYQGETPSYDFLKFVEEWGIGGTIVFARNLSDPEHLPAQLARIKEAAGQNIFTSIDQEGGLVLRILQKGSLFPSAMALSATDSIEHTEKTHAAMGREMLSLGLNWNLAPVLDINHPDNPGMGARSFGDTPQRVAEFGAAAIRGLQSVGVLACAKHFPGLGHAQSDSHLTLPVIPYSADHLEAFELVPFKSAIANDVAAIMTAHVFFPAFESAKDRPATLSETVLTGLLRDKLGFKGILVTDDLEMGAITESFGIAQAASLSFKAGADLLLICHQLEQQRAAAETILQLVRTDATYMQRLEESLVRITNARGRLAANFCSYNINVLRESHSQLIEKVSSGSVKFLRFCPSFIPVKKQTDKIVGLMPRISSLVQVEEEHNQDCLARIMAEEFPGARCHVYDPTADENSLRAIIGEMKLQSDEKLIFFTYNAHLFKGQQSAIQLISQQTRNVAVVALRNPYDLKFCSGIETCCATFGFRSPAVKAAIRAITGDTAPQTAIWPVDTAGW